MKLTLAFFLCLAFTSVSGQDFVPALRKASAETTSLRWIHAEYDEPYCRPLPPVDCSTMSEYLVPPNSGYCGLGKTFAILCHNVPGMGLAGVYIPYDPIKPQIREFANGIR